MAVVSNVIVRWIHALCAVVTCMSLCACGHRHDEGYSPSGDEPSLREKYPGVPALPASRDAFDAAVAAAGLRTEERVTRYVAGGPLTCPTPLRAPEKIRWRMERCLMIRGKDSPAFSEQYVAFIDAGGSVVYVENGYQYPAR